MSMGSRLRMARKAAGYTQKKLAELTDISPSSIANYETGISAPNEDILIRLMRVLEIDANFLYADDIIRQRGMTFLSPEEERMISLFRALNVSGQQMALTSLESFAGNPALTEEAQTGAS